MDLKREKCAILIPVHHYIEPKTEDGLRELGSRGYKILLLRGSSAIDMARIDMANNALAKGFEETFWIDSDVVFDPDDVDKVRAYGLPFVVGLYQKKGRTEFACTWWPDVLDEIVFGVGGGLKSVMYCGMGFAHVRREVYEGITKTLSLPAVKGGYTVGQKVIPWFLPMLIQDTDGPAYLGEDAAFCERARLAGYGVMADTTIRLGHIGPREWTWEDFAPQKKYDQLTFTPTNEPPINVSGLDLPPLEIAPQAPRCEKPALTGAA